jgi:hypothetical protein
LEKKMRYQPRWTQPQQYQDPTWSVQLGDGQWLNARRDVSYDDCGHVVYGEWEVAHSNEQGKTNFHDQDLAKEWADLNADLGAVVVANAFGFWQGAS